MSFIPISRESPAAFALAWEDGFNGEIYTAVFDDQGQQASVAVNVTKQQRAHTSTFCPRSRLFPTAVMR